MFTIFFTVHIDFLFCHAEIVFFFLQGREEYSRSSKSSRVEHVAEWGACIITLI